MSLSFPALATTFFVPGFMVGANTLAAVPLSNGKAGLVTSTFIASGVPYYVTVSF